MKRYLKWYEVRVSLFHTQYIRGQVVRPGEKVVRNVTLGAWDVKTQAPPSDVRAQPSPFPFSFPFFLPSPLLPSLSSSPLPSPLTPSPFLSPTSLFTNENNSQYNAGLLSNHCSACTNQSKQKSTPSPSLQQKTEQKATKLNQPASTASCYELWSKFPF